MSPYEKNTSSLILQSSSLFSEFSNNNCTQLFRQCNRSWSYWTTSNRCLATTIRNQAATTPSRPSTSTPPLRWPAPSSQRRSTDHRTRSSSTDTTTYTPTSSSASAAAKTTSTVTSCESSCRRRRRRPPTLVSVATPAVNFTEPQSSRSSVPSVTPSWSRSRTRPPPDRLESHQQKMCPDSYRPRAAKTLTMPSLP